MSRKKIIIIIAVAVVTMLVGCEGGKSAMEIKGASSQVGKKEQDAVAKMAGKTTEKKAATNKTAAKADAKDTPKATATPEATKEAEQKADATNAGQEAVQPGSAQPVQPAQPQHTHDWQPMTEVVHHEAEYTDNWVVDKEAWDEQVCTKEAWDETVQQDNWVTHDVCRGCGCYLDQLGGWDAIDAHLNKHILAGQDSSYYTNQFNEPITTTVRHDAEYQTIHHDAEGHNEKVKTKDAWDETVTTGYKCSCGAMK